MTGNPSFLCSKSILSLLITFTSVLIHHDEKTNDSDSDSDADNRNALDAMWKAKVVTIYKTSASKKKIKVRG